MSDNDLNPSINENSMSTEQLRDLLQKTSDSNEAKRISKILQERREEELISKAEEVPKPDLSLAYTTSTNSDCFIATACYGDTNHPDVEVFREWRDSILIKSVPGRIFIFLYYVFSPHLAKYISGTPYLSRFIRFQFLQPIAFRLRQRK